MGLWTFYEVVLPALVPIVFARFLIWIYTKPIRFFGIVGDGQLCFFSIVLVAALSHAIEVMDDSKRHTAWANRYLVWAHLSFILLIVINSVLFAIITVEKDGSNPVVKRRLTGSSVVAAIASLLVVYFWRFNPELFAGTSSIRRHLTLRTRRYQDIPARWRKMVTSTERTPRLG
jgi:hypothetical protein